MSFAAVAALIAVAEWEQSARSGMQPRGALYRYLRGIALTSLVGSLATMPFAHFHLRPRHPLRRAGQSAGHAGDGLCGDAGGGARRRGHAVRAGSRAAASDGAGASM